MIQEEAHDDANIIFGAVIDEKLEDELRITVIATGFGDKEKEARKPTLVSVAPKERPVRHLGTIVDDLDAPTWQRKKSDGAEPETINLEKALQMSQEDDDKFDIPTFLRRQMD
jgi:cell division protein FtsZ